MTITSYTKYDAPLSIVQYKFNNKNDIIEFDGLNSSDNNKTIIEYKYDGIGKIGKKKLKKGEQEKFIMYTKENLLIIKEHLPTPYYVN